MQAILTLRSGRRPLQDSEIVIAGVARNCARTLRANLDRLRAAFRKARDVRTLVVESDSTDGTSEELKRLAREHRDLRFVCLGRLAGRIPLRTERIAFCRNRYIEELKQGAYLPAPDYVVVADLDGVNRAVTEAAVASCWATHVEWDVCTANQSDFYYDIWALRQQQWCPQDCWQHYQHLLPLMGREQALQLAVYSKMVHLPTSAHLIEVESAFGGLAIYKWSFLKGARYGGLDDQGRSVSEHVILHNQIRKAGGHIYINPAFVNARKTSHSWNKKPAAKLFRHLFPDFYQPDPDGTAQRSPLTRKLQALRDRLA